MTSPDGIVLSLDRASSPYTEALGWQWGYGCFETFLWGKQGSIALEKHLERFCMGCRALNLKGPPPVLEWKAHVESCLDPYTDRTLRVRLEGVLDDPGLITGGEPPFRMRLGLRAVEIPPPTRYRNGSVRVLDQGASSMIPPLPSYKPLAYAHRLAVKNRTVRMGYDEGLVQVENRRVVSGLTSNLFVRTREGEWVTPPVGSGCLPGVTRGLVLESETPEKACEREVHLQDLTDASSVVLTNSVIGVQPVALVHLGNGKTRSLETGPADELADWYDRRFVRDRFI